MDAAPGAPAARRRTAASGAAAAGGPHIHALPDSVLGVIFEQLHRPDEAGPGVLLTCKRWQRVFFSLRRLELEGNELTELPDLGISTSLSTLSLRSNRWLRFSAESAEALASRCPSLGQFLLGGSYSLGALAHLARLRPDLQIG
ncbi:hypothetical protein ABPG75_010002 [Micractinium tetrahymenae]